MTNPSPPAPTQPGLQRGPPSSGPRPPVTPVGSIRWVHPLRLDTPQETLYYQHGGILQYVLRQMLSA